MRKEMMRKIIFGVLAVGLVLFVISWKLLVGLFSHSTSSENTQPNYSAASAATALPTFEQAMRDLFGVDSQTGAILTEKNGLTRGWFSYPFESNGIIYYAVFLKTQRSNGDVATEESVRHCHACAPDISVVTYKKQGQSWSKLIAQKNVAEVGSWGDVETPKRFEFLHLNEKNRILMIDVAWQGQGLNTWGKELFGFSEERWSRLGTIETGGNNEDHCLPPAAKEDERGHLMFDCYSYVGQIQLLQKKPVDFPDLTVIFSGTRLDDKLQLKQAENQTYHYVKGRYVLNQ